ncbi:ATP-binding cassette, sub-family D, member 3 [Cyanidioschyzon merolae strain 10D]|jgi:ATP-binding cassette subfamily D (ALD) protein 3|uniref:Probable ATP-dependent transporter ycf16 n=1 Tax=Cyanidioschyzon merolae (strain NIES-3377 / 10D) TaxID=280699 RepID=M1V3V5_CYAM1|nr:ATP-binding cassette, sub-family D, member 3 [Cyanidioschyzon merolae strain 10D]BAM78960.1 ATP-binding cassette, sub-family D, member 3 [Cyanidioschyzon merolae strain 10D]|eukprot:XP_005535246.1 ATP-binding cassette, sub-family D, member 3 [Cyanidioschyzon merolae strain 10D]
MEFAIGGRGPGGWAGAFQAASRKRRAARVAAAVVAGVAAVGGATYYWTQQTECDAESSTQLESSVNNDVQALIERQRERSVALTAASPERSLREHRSTGASVRSGTSRSGTSQSAAIAISRAPSMAALKSIPSDAASGRSSVRVDRKFFSQLWRFIRIIVPSIRSREFWVVLGIGVTLVIRTRLDIWVSDNAGDIVKAIVARDREAFMRKCVRDISIMMFPMSFVNNILKLQISLLRVMARKRLTLYFHELYLSQLTFYKATNLDNRIQNIDQLVTQDVEKFCTTLVNLYSNVSKPLLDVVLFSSRLARSLGAKGPAVMIGYFILTSAILRKLQPPFGRLTADEQRLEGDFRLCHSRLIMHAEEIAFYGGGQREKFFINGTFEKLLQHMQRIFMARFRIGLVDSILVKYLATIVGYCVVSMPIFFTSGFVRTLLAPLGGQKLIDQNKQADAEDAALVAEMYTRNSRLLISLSAAIGRLVLSGKELTRLAGYTARVGELDSVLGDLRRSQAADSHSSLDAIAKLGLEDVELRAAMVPGRLVDNVDFVRFEHVNIVSPDRILLAKDLTFEVPPGTNVLITGPNGCGKSSLFRVLCGLWPLYGGTLYRPPRSRMFYIPQRPYLAIGSLREQVIYPMTTLEMRSRNIRDEDLQKLLDEVHLGELSRRRNGWDNVCDWSDVLSGGEKQRLAMARLFFHRPQYAVLDECTSAVSLDVEGYLYTHARELGITLITVSHRPSLWRFHEKLLRFDGHGGWTFTDIKPEDIPQLTGINGESVAA